jgi:iron complex transport system ATP-binding protein
LLQATDLVFSYGRDTPVVRGVSLSVPDGALVGVLGPNGSGKTTLLRLLGGMRVPSSGVVTLDGVPLASMSRAAAARRIAMVPQETHLAFDYTVLEVVLMGRYTHLGAFAVEGPADIAIARDALAATGAAAFEDRLFSTLSGGEKQRVVIAGALTQITGSTDRAGRPPILLLDEPTAALDLKYHLGVASLLRRLHRERGLTIVVSTHDLGLAASLCETLVMIKHGRIIASGSVDEVMTPVRVRELYEVDVDIARHPLTGHLVVVPIGPADTGPQP